MLEKHRFSDSIILECLNIHYGIKAVSLELLLIGADMHASVYKVQGLGQIFYFIKLKQGNHHDISVEVVQLLQRAGIHQIIPPIKTIHGTLTQPIGDCTLIVYPFIEGQDGFHRSLTEDQWMKLGKTLKQVHTMEVPPSIQNRIRRETYSPKWREMVRSLYPHIETIISTDEITLKLQKFIKKNISTIYRLIDRAEQLEKRVRHHSLPLVLCHSDIHAGNVLIDNHDAIYIVDWDEPIMAPKERDLMFIGGGVGNIWNQPYEEFFFYKGYGTTEIHSTVLAYYRHERIVEDIAVYGQELLVTRATSKDRSEMYKQFIDMFEPQGVIDAAFATHA